jgi:hypothetical protein
LDGSVEFLNRAEGLACPEVALEIAPGSALGQVGDITQAPALLEGQARDLAFADKAYDSNALRALIATRYDRRIIHFNGFVHLAAAMIWRR